MIWIFFLVVAILVAAGFAGLVARRFTYDPLPAPAHTAHTVVPGAIERAADIDAIHFDTALRGYRMDQVDEVLEALRERLAAYESGDHPTMKLPRVPSSVRPREPR